MPKNSGHLTVLVLLTLALLGPWTLSNDGVPPPEWCRDPFLLLESGRCVELVSGITVLYFMVGVFPTLVMALGSGVPIFPLNARNILLMLAIFGLVLPYFSTLYQIHRGGRPGVVHLATWTLAALAALFWLPSAQDIFPLRMWGVWLYLAVAAGQLIWGGRALIVARRDRRQQYA
jgi:hypothetical protein